MIHIAVSVPNFFVQQLPLPAEEEDRAMRRVGFSARTVRKYLGQPPRRRGSKDQRCLPLLHFNATENPRYEWTLQRLREALPGGDDYKFLLHDRHKTFSFSLDETVENWDIRVLRTPVRMPTANAHCERLIGTIRRECLDYVIPLDASHLRRTLREWACHYNAGRPHRPLGPGIPDQSTQTPVSHKQSSYPRHASR